MNPLPLPWHWPAPCWPAAPAPRPTSATPCRRSPKGSSGYTEKPGWATTKFAVAAANPLATDAGYQILKAGGSAVDAAIAVQMVLTLVEPQSSGIGGGAFPAAPTARTSKPLTGAKPPRKRRTKSSSWADGKPMAFI
jgi:gamma-glutamyltranspeptidase/glutathione hydrolase